ncbi:hypothetical protein [Streptomyces sp. NPDC020141]|uniref:hypothetical protein n=1 Tax=Streptomyces sp. NPDC020141 TaxID=3365065 RepID=UPI0037A197CF
MGSIAGHEIPPALNTRAARAVPSRVRPAREETVTAALGEIADGPEFIHPPERAG